jgi:glutamate-1-semialdehyde aminotransferase
VVPWNDPERFTVAVDRFGEELAAVLAEPIPANMGSCLPRRASSRR